jgi:predicted ABC-type ATPase
LENPELSQIRVTERVTEGGHCVDPQTLNNNVYGNLEKINIDHPPIDDLTIVDTSEINHRILFKIVLQQIEFHVEREDLPRWFTDHLPAIVNYFP